MLQEIIFLLSNVLKFPRNEAREEGNINIFTFGGDSKRLVNVLMSGL